MRSLPIVLGRGTPHVAEHEGSEAMVVVGHLLLMHRDLMVGDHENVDESVGLWLSLHDVREVDPVHERAHFVTALVRVGINVSGDGPAGEATAPTDPHHTGHCASSHTASATFTVSCAGKEIRPDQRMGAHEDGAAQSMSLSGPNGRSKGCDAFVLTVDPSDPASLVTG
jgi:hypothetical protein